MNKLEIKIKNEQLTDSKILALVGWFCDNGYHYDASVIDNNDTILYFVKDARQLSKIH